MVDRSNDTSRSPSVSSPEKHAQHNPKMDNFESQGVEEVRFEISILGANL